MSQDYCDKTGKQNAKTTLSGHNSMCYYPQNVWGWEKQAINSDIADVNYEHCTWITSVYCVVRVQRENMLRRQWQYCEFQNSDLNKVDSETM